MRTLFNNDGQLKAWASERGLEMTTGSAIWHVDFFDVIVNDGQRMAIQSDGHVKMHDQYGFTDASAANMYIASDGFIYRSTSSRKIKKDIRYILDSKIALQFKPASFRAKSNDKSYLGFIAEDMWEIDHRLVDASDPNMPGLNVTAILAALTATVQQQQKEIDFLKKSWLSRLVFRVKKLLKKEN